MPECHFELTQNINNMAQMNNSVAFLSGTLFGAWISLLGIRDCSNQEITKMKNIRGEVSAVIAGLTAFLSATTLADQQGYEVSSKLLEEIVVTAQKRAESGQDVPVSLQAVSAATITELGASQLYDLSRVAPSLSVGGIPGSQVQAGLRGVVDYSRNIGIDSRMGVYIDGVYQGRSSTSNQPLLGLESVEILRGPQGTLFGKNTVSGAISLNTKKPSDEFDAFASFGGGNYGYVTGSLYINGPLSDAVSGSIAVVQQERDGHYRNSVLGKKVGDWEQRGIRAQLSFEPSDALDVRLSADYGRNESTGPLFTKFADPIYTTEKGPENDTQKFWGISSTINYQTSGGYMLSSITAYRENEYAGEGDEDFSGQTEAFQTRFDEYPEQFSQEFRLISPVNDSFDWVLGLYYFESSNNQNGRAVYLDPGVLLGNPALSLARGVVGVPAKVDTTSNAAFVHGNYRISDQWEVTAGLRVTRDEKDAEFKQVNTPTDLQSAIQLATILLGPDLGPILGPQMPGALLGSANIEYSGARSDTSVSPMVSINFKPSDDVMYYAKYSRGSQSGGFNTDFFPYVPSIEFDEETVDAFELGVKSVVAGGRLQLNADIFVQQYEDLQVFQRIEKQPSGTVIALTNAGESTSQGAEFEGVWLPIDSLRLNLNATYLDATYDRFENVPVAGQPSNYNGNFLSYAPEWKLFASAQYTMNLDPAELVFYLDYSHQGDSWSGPNQADERYHLDSFSLWNARLSYSSSDQPWGLTVWVNNLLDEEYFTNRSPASITNIDRVVWGNPRMWGITFTYSVD